MSNQPGQTQPQPQQLPYTDDLSVREIFADQLKVITCDGVLTRIELVVARPRETGPDESSPVLYPACRLLLHPTAVLQLATVLPKMIEILEKQGTLRRVAAGTETKQ